MIMKKSSSGKESSDDVVLSVVVLELQKEPGFPSPVQVYAVPSFGIPTRWDSKDVGDGTRFWKQVIACVV
jgi:hypothetical protein